MRGVVPLVVVTALLGGCYLSHERARPADAAVDGGVDAATGCDGAVVPRPVSNVSVDMLFVIDNSFSMAEEQISLVEQFPRMVTVLSSGDLDGDGTADFPPVRSLRVGVITTDLGMGAERFRCEELGHDARLRTGEMPPVPGCADSYPQFATFRPGEGSTVDAFAEDFSCVARVGIHGCGVEQPLEAALKALTPSTSSLRFSDGTVGHGDGVNAGFRRPGSVLTIVFVTDEDDCSLSDDDLWMDPNPDYDGWLRCVRYEVEALHPISRFVDGLRAIEPDPDSLVLAAITGVPNDLIAPGAAPDYDAILADPRMAQRPDPEAPELLIPACRVEGRGAAIPPRRILEALRPFEPNTTVQSICQSTFDGAILGIVDRLGTVIGRGGCRE